MVTTAKDGELHVLDLLLVGTLQPCNEGIRIVRRITLVTRRHDDSGDFFADCIYPVVEGHDFGTISMTTGALAQFLSETFAGARIRAVKNQERLSGADFPSCVGGAWPFFGLRGGVHTFVQFPLDVEDFDPFTWRSADVEISRLDGQCTLDLELVGWIVELEVKVLQDQCQGQQSLLPGEWPTNAASCTISKGLEEIYCQRMGSQCLHSSSRKLTFHALGGKFVKFSPYIRSGRKSSTSSPKTVGSRPTPDRLQKTPAPSGM